MVSMFLGIFIDGLWSPELLGHISPVVSVLLGILGNISSYEKLNVLQVSIFARVLASPENSFRGLFYVI